MRPLFSVLVLALLGCSGETGASGSTGTSPVPPSGGCPTGEWLRADGSCVAAGLPPDMPCPPGEWQRDDGSCVGAGVPPDGCGGGFAHDGDRSCEPVLPPDPCPPGMIAVPGETSCHELAPCGSGKWGDIPVEATTEYVDAAYAGMDSDGSPAKPWTTIKQAFNAAWPPGAVIAVAAGSYVEDVVLHSKRVRLWGRCPQLVEIVGTGTELAAVMVRKNIPMTEVHNLAITGSGVGIFVSGSEDVLLDRVWVHHTASRGLDVEDAFGPTSVLVTSSLLEQTREVGAHVSGSRVTALGTVVRGTLTTAAGAGGRGVNAQASSVTGARADLTLRASLLDANHDLGVFVVDSDATIEASVVRGTLPASQGDGRGIAIQNGGAPGERASLLLRTSLIEENRDMGVRIRASDATIESTVIRGTLPNATGGRGRGLAVQDDPSTGERSAVTVRTSVLDQNHEVGGAFSGSDATVEATVVRGTLPIANGGGHGLFIDHDAGQRSDVALRSCLVEQNHEVGVIIDGSDVAIDATVVRATSPNADGLFGLGMQLQPACTASSCDASVRSTAAVRATLIEESGEAGIFVFTSDLSIEASVVRATRSNADDRYGDGVVVLAAWGPAQAIVAGTRIEESARAAISSFGGFVALGSSVLACQGVDLDGEDYEGVASAFEDQGGNACGCPDVKESCQLASSGIAPPEPLGPPTE